MRLNMARIVLLSLALLAIMPGCRSSTRPEPPPAPPELRAGLRVSSYGFQFGYPADRVWWQALEQPPTAIGQALREAIPNVTDLYRVDFTARELWP